MHEALMKTAARASRKELFLNIPFSKDFFSVLKFEAAQILVCLTLLLSFAWTFGLKSIAVHFEAGFRFSL